MMEKTRLRGMDIITSGLFALLGIYIIAEAFTMPLKDSYAGVESVWYVSPALMPFIIGGAMLILAFFIFLHALREGGMEALRGFFAKGEKKELLSEANIRYAAVLVPLVALVYLNITRIDFFLSIVLYLVFTIAVFHLDDKDIMRKLTAVYSAEMGFIFLLALTGLDKILKSAFIYAFDLIALIMIASISVFLVILARSSGKAEYRKKLRQAFWMTWLTPVFVVPIFRFMLRVPLPVEGIIVNVMSYFYYINRQ